MLSGIGASVGGGDMPADRQKRVRELIVQFETVLLAMADQMKIAHRFIRPLLSGSIVCGSLNDDIFVGYNNHLGMPTVVFTTLNGSGGIFEYYNILRDNFGVDFAVVALNESWLDSPQKNNHLRAVASDIIARELSSKKAEAAVVANESIFGPNHFPVQDQMVFVLMPFEEKLTEVYTAFVKPAVEEKGLVCRRADDIASNNAIIQDIWKSICEARFIVADISTLNANVMYELGIAHAIGKETLLINQDGTASKFPFDISHIRILNYRNTAAGGSELKHKLGPAIDSILTKLTAKAMTAS